MRVPDTHAHLDAEQFDVDRDEVVLRAEQAGVTRILAVGSDLRTSELAVACAHRYPLVYAAVGMHPHEASRFDEDAPGLQTLLNEDKVVAVGEIGLDFHRDWTPRAAQMDAFRTQLRWASERDLPVSIHSRGAEAEVLECVQLQTPSVVLHCFGGDASTAMQAISMGCFLSFAGNVTYPKAQQLREVARAIPQDRLLVESDSPVLAPQSHRGRRNEPAFVVDTVALLATERAETPGQLADSISTVAASLFNWSVE